MMSFDDFLDATTHLYKRSCPSVGPSVGPSVRPSVGPSVRPSVPCYFRTTKNVLSDVPMTTKFDIHQETVKDNSKVTSKCRSVGLSVHRRRKIKGNEQKVTTR